MSAQEFKPGDRVRCVDVTGQPSENLKLDDTALYTVASITHHGWLTLTSNPGPWLPSRFVKVDLESIEPEFVVGQQVSGDDYERLPVGSKVSDEGGIFPLTKAGPDVWMSASGNAYKNSGLMDPRTLTHLGDGTHAEPEDKDDLYVEPEPLKEGVAPAFNDDDVHHLKVISGSTTIFDGLAVFEEADNGNINVTPVPRCTSLLEKAGSILRCGQHEGHSDAHWTVGSTPAAAWSDERAYGRVVAGGAS